MTWFIDYLNNRFQQVRCNGVTSSLRPIKCGVQQGSNLGPLLFLININDLPQACKIVKIIFFGDDTNICLAHESRQKLARIVNKILQLLDEWFRVKRLSLNIDKTNFTAFHTYRENVPTMQNKHNGVNVKQAVTSKFLMFLVLAY